MLAGIVNINATPLLLHKLSKATITGSLVFAPGLGHLQRFCCGGLFLPGPTAWWKWIEPEFASILKKGAASLFHSHSSWVKGSLCWAASVTEHPFHFVLHRYTVYVVTQKEKKKSTLVYQFLPTRMLGLSRGSKFGSLPAEARPSLAMMMINVKKPRTPTTRSMKTRCFQDRDVRFPPVRFLKRSTMSENQGSQLYF